MTRKRTDHNQKAIVEAFRKIGYQVFDASSLGKGFPDLILGKHGETFHVEVKNPGRSWKYTEAQTRFLSEWQGGPIYTVETIDDVADLDREVLSDRGRNVLGRVGH